MNNNEENINPLTNKNFSTHLVMFDKPKFALLNDCVKEVYGMILATTCEHTDKYDGGIQTYRIPLTGELLEPEFPFSSKVEFEMRLLPENKKINTTLFKEMVDDVKYYGFIMQFLETLAENHFTADIHTETVTVKVKANEKGTYLTSDWFNMYSEKAGKKNFTPQDALIIFRFMQYLDRPFVFEPEHNAGHALYKAEKQIADEYTRLQEVFLTNGYYSALYYEERGTDAYVYYDGTYLYKPRASRSRVRMSLSGFLKKYPNARLTNGKENVFHPKS